MATLSSASVTVNRAKRGPSPHGIHYIWNRVDIKSPDQCWELTGKSRNKKGYGRIRIQQKLYLPHRAAYISMYGDIPDGFFVLHMCHNSLCCNHDYLYLGTHQDNMRDARQHGKIGGYRPGSGRKSHGK